MGPEDKNEYTVYWDDVPLEPGKIQEITLPPEMMEPVKELTCQCVEFTLHFKTPKHWRCQSRKRFIKLLLMSKGISRNEAESVARVARIAGVPYGELWRSYFFWG